MSNKFIYTNILGTFIFNNQFKIVEILEDEKQAKQKYKNALAPEEKHLKQILLLLKNREYFERFRNINLQLTKQAIKKSVNPDNFIIQSINNIDEIDKAANLLSKRLREWYELYLPEFSKSIESHEKFTELILTKSKKELLHEINMEDSMGADLNSQDLQPIKNLAESIDSLYKLKQKHEIYLEQIMKQYCPNLLTLAGTLIGAKLLEHAGSLKRLALFPASTVQLLGAEKALFRHIINRKHKPPRHGLIINHPLVSKAKDKDRGKVARALADKLSIASRVDYFKGQFIADKLKKVLEEKFR